MDILHARVALRERSLLDVVDLAVRFVVKHAKIYGKVSAIVLLPNFLFTWAAAAYAGWGWGWTVAFLLGAFAQTPFTVLASRLVFEAPVQVRVRDILGSSIRALPRLFLARFLQL